MLTVTQVANYIAFRYLQTFAEHIEEEKLQKLMYFAQRESIIQTGAPLFEAEFRAMQNGPVLPEVRDAYRSGQIVLSSIVSDTEINSTVFDDLFTDFAFKKTSSLVRLSKGQLSWERARIGYGEYESSDEPMKLTDIIEDAEKAKQRYAEVKVLRKLQPILDQYRAVLRNVHML